MKKLLLVSTTLLGLYSVANADVDLKHFNNLIQGVTVEEVQPSVIDGLYEVFVKESPYPIFLSKDGKYMLEGNAIDLIKGVNMSENYANRQNKEKIAKINPADMVIYKSPKETNVVTVFTTTDCPYCRMLHAQIDDYLAEGITVRYIAFPYRGLSSEGYQEMVSVWCADNRNKALDDAVAYADNRGRVKPKPANCKNPIADQYQLALEMGVQGTPAIILEDGAILPGYLPPKELRKRIDARDL